MEEWTKIRLENQMKNISSLEQIKPFVKNNAEDIIELLFEEINKLKAKLIEEQDFKLAYTHDLDEEGQLIKSIRHQVCDEIREKLKKQIIPTAGSWLSYYDIMETNNLLDQIEKGDK